MQTFLLILTVLIGVGNLVALWFHHKREVLPRIYVNNEPVTAAELKKIVPGGTMRIQQNPKKGSVFIPPSEIDEERERILAERSAEGLDTPIDLLREKNDDED